MPDDNSSVARFRWLAGRPALIALFVVFLLPIDVEGLSINYAYLLLPVITILWGGRMRKPPEPILLLMGLYAAIFVAAVMRDIPLSSDHELRRVISFILFFSIFSYALIRIDADIIDAFSSALVVVSVVYAAYAIVSIWALDTSAHGMAKDMVGTQRYGFVYLMAFWVAFLRPAKGFTDSAIRLSSIIAILVGLFLTYSRASIIALMMVLTIYVGTKTSAWFVRQDARTLLRALQTVVVFLALVAILVSAFPTTMDYFNSRLVNYFADSSEIVADLGDPASSGGTRLYIVSKTFQFLSAAYLVGSGYLGVWTLNDPLFGSAHNQLLDVLFRTGILGFSAYVALILAIAILLYRGFRPLFWGFVGVLFYGVFHETFKESQGAFLLTFFTGMLSQFLRVRLAMRRQRAS